MAADAATGAAPDTARPRFGRGGDHRHLLAGSAALVVGAAVQAVTGAVFWLVAARIDTTDDVGRATALFTSILFIAYLAGLGLQVSLARFAPDRDHELPRRLRLGRGRHLRLGARVVATGYLLARRHRGHAGAHRLAPVGGPVLFIAAAVGAALTLIVDVRWMTVRRWRLVLARIAVVGLAPVPAAARPGRRQPDRAPLRRRRPAADRDRRRSGCC